jgi:hypothetical protein
VSELLYDWRFTANQFFLTLIPLRLTATNFFPPMNTCSHSLYITSSLTRGWVCHLQLLLALASTFILGSESRGTRDRILLSQIRNFPFCCLLRLAGLRWRYSTPPPHGNISGSIWISCYITSGRTARENIFQSRIQGNDYHPAMDCFQEYISTGMCLPSRCVVADGS